MDWVTLPTTSLESPLHAEMTQRSVGFDVDFACGSTKQGSSGESLFHLIISCQWLCVRVTDCLGASIVDDFDVSFSPSFVGRMLLTLSSK